MTTASETVSFRCPVDLKERLPAPGNGRSKFIVRALRESLERPEPRWQPTTARGRKLAALLAKGKAERGPEMSLEEVERELRDRKGRRF